LKVAKRLLQRVIGKGLIMNGLQKIRKKKDSKMNKTKLIFNFITIKYK
jgi:hypothetical protein